MTTHRDQMTVPFAPEQLFDLVADVGRYPEFLPWCVGARVLTRGERELVADLAIGFGPLRESFTSRVTLERPRLIRATYENGPFRYLNNQWVFTGGPAGTQVDFWVDFEFRNKILQRAMGTMFNEAVKRMVAAFLKRARELQSEPVPAPVGAAGARA